MCDGICTRWPARGASAPKRSALGSARAEIARQKAVMGRWTYSAQYQQDPIPEGGAIFQREWFSHRFHRDKDTGIPLGAKLRMVIQSWDTAAKKKESNDYWACTTWGLVAGEDSRIRMLDCTMDRMEYVEGRQKVKDQYAKWKDTTAVLIEDSSSGTAIISELRTTGISGASWIFARTKTTGGRRPPLRTA